MDRNITLTLDTNAIVSLQGMIHVVVEKGNPLEQRAAMEIGDLLAKSMLAADPELKDRALEAIKGAADDLPEGIAEALIAKLEDGDPSPLTEKDLEGVDVGDTIDKILRNASDDLPEAG